MAIVSRSLLLWIPIALLFGCERSPEDQLRAYRQSYFESLEGEFPCVEYVKGWYDVIADPENPFGTPEFPSPGSKWDEPLEFYTCMLGQAEQALASLERFKPSEMIKSKANQELKQIRDRIVAIFQVGGLFSKQWRVCSESRYTVAECEAASNVMYRLWSVIDDIYDEVWPLNSVDHHYLTSNLSEATERMRRYIVRLNEAIEFFRGGISAQ